MSKKYSRTKRRQSLAEQLDKIVRYSKNEVHRMDAQEMVLFFVRNGFVPFNLQERAKELVSLNKDICKKIPIKRIYKKHYLYAITDGENIKVGYSVNPEKRLKAMQTGNPNELKLLWKCFVGDDDKQARRQESKLHRRLKRFKIDREWFSHESLEVIQLWRGMSGKSPVKNYKDRIIESQEIELLLEAKERL